MNEGEDLYEGLDFNESGPFLATPEPEFPCIESMTTIFQPGKKIRVWRTEAKLSNEYDNQDLYDLAHEHRHADKLTLHRALANAPRVSAVEITDKVGNGCVVYKEWP